MNITYCYTREEGDIMYCYTQKLSAATLIVLSKSKSRLSAARVAWRLEFGCFSIVFVKHFNFAV